MSAAAARAQALNDIGDDQSRTLVLTEFQASLGILDRIIRSGSLSRADADGLIGRLAAVDHANKGYGARIAAWIQKDLSAEAARRQRRVVRPARGHAAWRQWRASVTTDARDRVVEWEGRRYRVNAPRAEELRLHRVRQRQGGRVAPGRAAERAAGRRRPAAIACWPNTLTSILYAAYLGDPQGPALAGGNVALRHDLGATGVARAARRVASCRPKGTRARAGASRGSLLGLDVALARLSLRRLDSSRDAA